jgi:purine-binding chemotaxis protein CheW
MFDEDVLNDDEHVEEDTSSTYLTFDLSAQAFGLDVRFVREIIDPKRITPLPDAPREVLGVVDVRGESVPIVDLRGRLGVLRDEFEENARMIILEVSKGGDQRLVGIQADRVRNVENIPRESIEPVPNSGFTHWDAGILLGLFRKDGDFIVLIDLQSILGDATEELLTHRLTAKRPIRPTSISRCQTR